MNVDAFFSLAFEELEKMNVTAAVKALWYDFHGGWDDAHEYVQDDTSMESAWVHAYLHRKEGDISNARYWYTMAGKVLYKGALDDERADILTALLS